MTDTQLIALALVFVAALGSVLYNNSRITGLRDTVNNRFNEIGKRFDDVNRHIDDKFALLSQQMKHMEENIMRILGDRETRIQKLEGNK
jgi:predicted Holliday junction resolvase-like endonuclease